MEIWRNIPGYEGLYQASSLGNIKSLYRFVKCVHGGRRSVPERILKPGRFCKAGHVSVTLGKGTNGKPVHQLIALTFIGPRPKGADTRHLNGDPTNNRLDNLAYGTRTENILDVYAQGKAWRKLTTVQVLEIRDFIKSGLKDKELSKKYNVNIATINCIRHKKTFYWLGDGD